MVNTVTVTTPRHVLGKEALEVRIKTSKGALGTVVLTASKIKWLPSPNSKKGFDLSWDQFAEQIGSIANPVKKVITKRSRVKKAIQKAANKKLASKGANGKSAQ